MLFVCEFERASECARCALSKCGEISRHSDGIFLNAKCIYANAQNRTAKKRPTSERARACANENFYRIRRRQNRCAARFTFFVPETFV